MDTWKRKSEYNWGTIKATLALVSFMARSVPVVSSFAFIHLYSFYRRTFIYGTSF